MVLFTNCQAVISSMCLGAHGVYLGFVLWRSPSDFHIERLIGVGFGAVVMSLQTAVLFGSEALLIQDLTTHLGSGIYIEGCNMHADNAACSLAGKGCKWDAGANACVRDMDMNGSAESTFNAGERPDPVAPALLG